MGPVQGKWVWTSERERVGGISLVVQWLRHCAPNAGGMGSIPDQGTGFHRPQLRVCMPELKIPHATTKIKDPVCCN